MARATARKRALNTLYEADEKSQDILSLLQERLQEPGAPTPLPAYAVEIVTGVANSLPDIDASLNAHAKGWSVKRMAVIDRNILRMAAWEISYNDEVPDKVAIDEALTLAKSLCDAKAPAFIHGILSNLCTDEASSGQDAVFDSAQEVNHNNHHEHHTDDDPHDAMEESNRS